MQIRLGNYLLRTGRLFQQYIVDMYVKIENTRLDFLRTNQDAIRSDLYQGVIDTHNLGEESASRMGKRVVLPPSFIGGPRDLKRRFLNAMALVNRYGKPDLFLTITCNPNWPEITSELQPGEKTQDRPDLVARIFHAKLIALKKEIMDKKCFGDVAAMIHVVEFQKRGLPHAHFLIVLKSEYKLRTPEQYDKYTCAEIPDASNAHLRKLVLRHMLHGPCGVYDPNCPCMKNHNRGTGKCKFGYPKKFIESTTTGTDSFPLYRRRKKGNKVRVRGHNFDNRWVIPYNPYLLAMFGCHLNVEVCSTIKAVKYLYKYVYKGHDRISFDVLPADQNHVIDEITSFQSGRWISPPEAAWRIFGFDLYNMFPAVFPLQVHVNNMQYVRFRAEERVEDILQDDKRAKTMLTEFFIANLLGSQGTKYLYGEFPEHFVWDSSKKEWRERKQRLVIGRLAYATPAEEERYYLRLLLQHVRGPTSFEDLLTIDGQKCETFQDAALKLGLLEQDNSIDQCMEEASLFELPRALRRLFATILNFCHPANPSEIWVKYYEELSADFQHELPQQAETVLQLTIESLSDLLEGMGKSLEHYGLSHLKQPRNDSTQLTKDVKEALSAPIPQVYYEDRKRLNTQQKAAYKFIIQKIKNGDPGAIFIDGPGGTGKTFLYCTLYAKVRKMGLICLPTATSGIAASNIPTGRTVHSRFKIPPDNNSSLVCDIPKQSSAAHLLKEAALIIWDEASMANKENIEALDKLLQDICNTNVIFGGKTVVLGGDFRQVLPVVLKKTQAEAVQASIVSSHLWEFFTKFSLTENVRAKEDAQYAQFLLKLGNGGFQTNESEDIIIPKEMLLDIEDHVTAIDELVSFVFPHMQMPTFEPSIFTTRAILTPKNEDVDVINKLLIEKFPGNTHVYRSFDSVLDEKCNLYPEEFLNSLCPSGMSPNELVLKKNCPVILLRNLDPPAGLCNGTRLICKTFCKNLIECEIATGYYAGETVFLPRITLRPPSSVNYPFHFERKQFPIKLSFAMTINKAQGQTLQQVGVYLPRPCFSHGQLYVALSRARKREQLKIYVPRKDGEETHTQYIRNVVSFGILHRAGII